MAKKVKKSVGQKQKQTQIVNINLATKAKRKPRKRQPRKEVQRRIPAFNPPPIINFPPQYKPYSVYPEGETAKIFNLNSAVPVPLKIETELLNAPIPAPNLAKSVAEPIREEPFVEDDISVLTEAPEFVDLPEEARSQVLDLPPAEASALVENKEPIFDPFLPVPASAQSSASAQSLAESIAEPPTEAGFSYPYSESGLSLPQSQFLGGPNILFLPPIKAEKSEVPFSPLPSSGLTLAPVEKSTKLEGFTGPLVVKTEEEQRTAKGRKQRGPNLSPALRELKKIEEAERKKAERKEKKDREKGASLFEFLPTTANVEPLGIPIQIGLKGADEGFKYSAPLSQLEGQYQFIGQPKPPTEKEQGGLERRRGGGVLSAAEEAIIGGTPAFLAQPAFIA